MVGMMGKAVRPSPVWGLFLLTVAQSGVELLTLLIIGDLLRRGLLLMRVLLADLLALIVSAHGGVSFIQRGLRHHRQRTKPLDFLHIYIYGVSCRHQSAKTLNRNGSQFG